MFKECDGSKARDREFRVVRNGEHPAAALGIDGLDGQLHGLNLHFRGVKWLVRCKSGYMPQPRPHLRRLPRFRQSHQRGHDGGQSRGLVSGNIILCVAISAGISLRILVNGRQGEVPPLSRLGELYLYFCVVHIILLVVRVPCTALPLHW
uniref:Uncharacterized protein n=1 Tax=Myoviridae sp. ctZYN8 TaxID=2825128 RepID=A0A8S5UA89_9CAUD|nr:MAG TPA: hypothetical protein [Myoviridae sp. ctZYN8]